MFATNYNFYFLNLDLSVLQLVTIGKGFFYCFKCVKLLYTTYVCPKYGVNILLFW